MNMGSKQDSLKVMTFMYLALDFYAYPYGHQTWLAPTQEIRALALVLQLICSEYRLEAWLTYSNEIGVLALEMQPVCAE